MIRIFITNFWCAVTETNQNDLYHVISSYKCFQNGSNEMPMPVFVWVFICFSVHLMLEILLWYLYLFYRCFVFTSCACKPQSICFPFYLVFRFQERKTWQLFFSFKSADSLLLLHMFSINKKTYTILLIALYLFYKRIESGESCQVARKGKFAVRPERWNLRGDEEDKEPLFHIAFVFFSMTKCTTRH